MAMATRLRTKKPSDNAEPTRQFIGKTSMAPKLTLADAKEKRRVFGDIENKIGSWSSSTEDKAAKPIAAYKDVKPRVDTRWKKAEAVGTSKTTKTIAGPAPTAATKPILRQQTSRPKLTITESITAQLRKVTKLPETKKERTLSSESSSNGSSNELQIKKSPFKRKEKTVQVQKNYYDSHSTKLLGQIDDIDEKDIQNPQMLPEYVNDIYRYLSKLEIKFPIRDNFLANQTDVTPKMRSVLLDWINEVHNQFSLEIETYHMAVSMIDRYLQLHAETPRRYLQLVGVTALFTSSKYEELMPPEISDFVYVTDDTYSKQQIFQMEKKLLAGLGFNLSKPLPIHFLRRFVKAAGTVGDRQYIAAKYFLELASIDYEMTKYKYSEVAAASLHLALYIFNTIKSDSDLWTPTLAYYSTYTAEELMPIMKRLAFIVSNAKDNKLKSVYTKYSHAVYLFVAALPEMSGVKIKELVNRP